MIVFIFILMVTVVAQCAEHSQWEEIRLPNDKYFVKENRSLQGHNLTEHRSPTISGCFLTCTDNCLCLSFNFQSDDRAGVANCQLNEAATYTNSDAMVWKAGWTYVELDRSYTNPTSKVTVHLKILFQAKSQNQNTRLFGTTAELTNQGYPFNVCQKPY